MVMLAVVVLAVIAYVLFKTPIGAGAAPWAEAGSPLHPPELDVSDIEADIRPLKVASGRQHVSGATIEPPPPGLPLAATRAVLSELADQGDARSSCRLALELTLCSSITDDSLSATDSMVRRGSPVPIDVVAQMVDRTDRIVDLCRDAGEIPVGEPEERARRAATSGAPRHRTIYALMSPNGLLSRLHNAENLVIAGARNRPVTQFYADNARRFLDEGFAHGDLLALEGLILAHVPTPVTRLVPSLIQDPDPFRFVVLAGLYETLGTAALPHDIRMVRDSVLAEYPPEVRGEVQELIEREHLRWSGLKSSRAAPPNVSPDTVDELCTE